MISETPNRSFLSDDVLIKISVSSTNSEDVISSYAKVRNYIKNFNSQNENSRLEVLTDASETRMAGIGYYRKYLPGYDFSINISFTFFKLKAGFLGSFWPTSFIFGNVYFCATSRGYDKCIINFWNDYSNRDTCR